MCRILILSDKGSFIQIFSRTLWHCIVRYRGINGHNFRAYQVTNLKTLEEETCKHALQVCIDIKSRVKEMFPLFIFVTQINVNLQVISCLMKIYCMQIFSEIITCMVGSVFRTFKFFFNDGQIRDLISIKDLRSIERNGYFFSQRPYLRSIFTWGLLELVK